MILTPGKAIVNNTSFDWRSCCPIDVVRSAKGFQWLHELTLTPKISFGGVYVIPQG